MTTGSTQKSSRQGDKWRLKIGVQIHGPYNARQIRSLVMQGIVTPTSEVSPEGRDTWGAAHEVPALAGFFKGPQKAGFGRRHLSGARGTGQDKKPGTNFVLVFDIKADSNNDLEQAINNLGHANCVMRNTWVLHSTYTIGAVRNALVQYLRTSDSLFIVDADHGKTAWFNLGVENDAKIRQIWKEDDAKSPE